MDHKRRPSPHLTADANSTIMCLNNLLRNSKTETRAMPFSACAGRINLIEPIKETRQRFIRYAYAGVRDRDLYFSRNIDRPKSDLSIGRSKRSEERRVGKECRYR